MIQNSEKISKRETVRKVNYVRSRTVQLKNLVLDIKKTTDIDMRDEILAFLTDRFERADKRPK